MFVLLGFWKKIILRFLEIQEKKCNFFMFTSVTYSKVGFLYVCMYIHITYISYIYTHILYVYDIYIYIHKYKKTLIN